jgi:hypothetical protein
MTFITKNNTSYYNSEKVQLNIKKNVKLLLTFVFLTFISVNLSAQILSTYCDGNPADWANFTTTYPINGYKLDVANAASNLDDQFTQGSKDESLIQNWRWAKGNANAKGDITNAGVALTGTNNCILRFFGDRTSDNGDASIGFWLFRNAISTNSDGTFSGVHSNGDILILSDFTSGGTTPTIKVYEWLNGSLVLQSSSTARCANVNQVTRPVPAGLTFTASNGSTSYAPNLFFEGAIDLCALNISTCFASFLVETRNSQSITASLQDFALGSFNATPPTPAATVDQPTCTVATGTVNVTNPVAGYTYTLTGTSPVRPPITSTTGTFTNVLPGTYALRAAQGSCLSSPSTVVVNAQPPTPATPQANVTQPTCAVGTGTITVTAPLGSGLTYSIGGNFQSSTTFNNVEPGSYTLTVKNSSGCTQTNAVVVNPQPATPPRPVITIQEATLCGTLTAPTITVMCPVSGSTYTLTQTGVAGSQVKTYNGTGTVVFTVQAGKQFSITVTNASGCTSGATNCTNYTTNSCPPAIVAKKSAPKASEQVVKYQSKISAFPNPYNDKVSFSLQAAESGKGSLEIYNMLGQKVKTVFQGYLEKGQQQRIEYAVPASQRANLIYLFRLNEQKITGKLMGLK